MSIASFYLIFKLLSNFIINNCDNKNENEDNINYLFVYHFFDLFLSFNLFINFFSYLIYSIY